MPPKSEAEQKALIKQFREATKTDIVLAKSYLNTANWNLQTALDQYYSEGESGPSVASSSTGSSKGKWTPKSNEAKGKQISSRNSSSGSSGTNRVTTLADLLDRNKTEEKELVKQRKKTSKKGSKGKSPVKGSKNSLPVSPKSDKSPSSGRSGSESSSASRGSSLFRSPLSKAGQDKKQGGQSVKTRTLRTGSGQPSDQTEILLRFTNGRRKLIKIKLKDKLSAIRKYIEINHPELNENPFVFLAYTNDNEIAVVDENQTVQESGLENSVFMQHRKLGV